MDSVLAPVPSPTPASPSTKSFDWSKWAPVILAGLMSLFVAWKSGWQQPVTIPAPLTAQAAQPQPIVIVVGSPGGSSPTPVMTSK
jgi:hypothetical protein